MRNIKVSLTLVTKSQIQRPLSNLSFVPKCNPINKEDVKSLKKFLESYDNICVLTGAGISTESGIPDYRSETVGLFATTNRRPVLYKDFCENNEVRRRYWARNYIGWPRFSSFEPNVTHNVLKNLEEAGKVSCIITQNVDNLHIKAGSKNVIELHGTAFRVICLNCNEIISRHSFQQILDHLNPDIHSTNQTIRPDGDVELCQEDVEKFRVPSCSNCGGILKPDIVFFGDNVPRKIVERIKQEVHNANSLLILGTSLTTFSGYRIVLQAVETRKPIVIVNIGGTRADEHANLKIQAQCGEILSEIYKSELRDVS